MVNVYPMGYVVPLGFVVYRSFHVLDSTWSNEDMKPVLRELQRLNPFRGASASGVVVPREVHFFVLIFFVAFLGGTNEKLCVYKDVFVDMWKYMNIILTFIFCSYDYSSKEVGQFTCPGYCQIIAWMNACQILQLC